MIEPVRFVMIIVAVDLVIAGYQHTGARIIQIIAVENHIAEFLSLVWAIARV